MTIGSDYPSPVLVNGYVCRNCTDVDLAKKMIDPDHPEDGPGRINVPRDTAARDQAVCFGGALAGLDESTFQTDLAQRAGQTQPPAGTRLDLTA